MYSCQDKVVLFTGLCVSNPIFCNNEDLCSEILFWELFYTVAADYFPPPVSHLLLKGFSKCEVFQMRLFLLTVTEKYIKVMSEVKKHKIGHCVNNAIMILN